jgi:hypothetical protein
MAQTLSNIRVVPSTVTWNSVELGYTEGDIEISMEEQVVDITAHQTGSELLDSIRTGSSVEVTVTLKETSLTQLQTLFEVAGGTNTPASGTKGSGWGSSQQFTGQLADAQKLVIHPIAEGASLLKDIAFWKAYPMLNSLTISSENPQTVAVTFKIFRDTSKLAAIDKFVIGDHTQTFA